MEIFEVRKLDSSERSKGILEKFYQSCRDDGIKNNSSPKDMKIGRKADEHWWGVVHETRLIAISGAYPCDDFEPNGWRVLFRSATLVSYRATAGHFSKKLNHDFCYGRILPLQLELARKSGASFLFFTTNTDNTGDEGSNRANQFVKKVLLPLGEVELYRENIKYFNCQQNIWRLKTLNT